MIPYWLFFTLAAFPVFLSVRLNSASERLLWGFFWLFFSLVVGLRFEVGGDWFTYFHHFEFIRTLDFLDVWQRSDPGYYYLNWLVGRLGGSVYWVNLICASIVVAGVIRFSRAQPLPWLSFLVAIPYLLIVVAMGYTRQSVALGFLLFGLAALGEGHRKKFVIYVLLGAAFHKSAVLMLPLGALSSTTNRFWSIIWGLLITFLGGYFFLFDSVDRFWTNYVEADYHSRGGLIRVMMNAVPAVFFLCFYKSLSRNDSEKKLWLWISVLSVVCIPLVMISSTATDRVALYLIPVQLFVFSRLPFLASSSERRAIIAFSVFAYYSLVMAIWLFFANHAHAWLPYRFAPFN